jgi:hypothetical protein
LDYRLDELSPLSSRDLYQGPVLVWDRPHLAVDDAFDPIAGWAPIPVDR